MESEERQLLERARRGDLAAFGGLVGRHEQRLFRSVRQMVPSEEDARDICQEAFVNAWQNLAKYRGDSAFYTWLYRIAFNASVSLLRSKKQTRSLDGPDDQDAPNLGLADGRIPAPDVPLDRREKAAEVRRALGLLSPEHRSIIILKEMDDRPYDEIAEILGIPVGTVRSRLHRARDELKTVFERLELQ